MTESHNTEGTKNKMSVKKLRREHEGGRGIKGKQDHIQVCTGYITKSHPADLVLHIYHVLICDWAYL